MLDLDGLTLVTELAAEYRYQSQRLDYESVRKDCLSLLR